MSQEDAIRELSGKVGELSGIMQASAKAQQETNDRLVRLMERHEEADKATHAAQDKKISDVADEVKSARRVAFGLALGAGGASGGFLGKLAAFLGGSGHA